MIDVKKPVVVLGYEEFNSLKERLAESESSDDYNHKELKAAQDVFEEIAAARKPSRIVREIRKWHRDGQYNVRGLVNALRESGLMAIELQRDAAKRLGATVPIVPSPGERFGLLGRKQLEVLSGKDFATSIETLIGSDFVLDDIRGLDVDRLAGLPGAHDDSALATACVLVERLLGRDQLFVQLARAKLQGCGPQPLGPD